MIRLPRILYHA